MFRRIRRRVEPITDKTISIRAYQLWEARGRPDCDGAEDWQNAKDQLSAESKRFLRRRPLRRLLARLSNRAA
jgi:hypothetical protein